ncbi:hypothetical protein XBFM1_2200015 [Xenorhabdus bovienii str. feltiae Moldova]|uniref:Uncharacterized protein n=1 Tax=Xenorhabdus bovienii str. feltiae Moldova TaxID=1398200 RepID=A0A077NRP1_XENBV|nr:hypothetical protein XBFM1_2200015 [Xenorhabdus bovienii str. feltiae Moldova]
MNRINHISKSSLYETDDYKTKIIITHLIITFIIVTIIAIYPEKLITYCNYNIVK